MRCWSGTRSWRRPACPRGARRTGVALREAVADPEVLGRVRALGGEPFGGGEAEAAGFLKAQQRLWTRVVRERHVTRE